MNKPLTILIVDDDDDDKEMFIEAMSEIGFASNCIKASNGNEALQILNNEEIRPDCIFLDLNMPRMNGWQCLQQLKNDKKYGSIPVVIYTTSKIEEDKTETKRLGASHFITKPNSLKQLKEELEFVFTEKQGILTKNVIDQKQ